MLLCNGYLNVVVVFLCMWFCSVQSWCQPHFVSRYQLNASLGSCVTLRLWIIYIYMVLLSQIFFFLPVLLSTVSVQTKIEMPQVLQVSLNEVMWHVCVGKVRHYRMFSGKKKCLKFVKAGEPITHDTQQAPHRADLKTVPEITHHSVYGGPYRSVCSNESELPCIW